MKLKSNKIKILVTVLFTLSMILLFSVSVSAAIETTIDYEKEIIELTGSTNDGTVKYMYCPNVNPELVVKLDGNGDVINEAAEKKKLAAEKWYPVYGDSVEISQFIPRSNEIKFAFRDADEFPDADGVYKSRVLSDYIPSRPENINQSFLKSNIKYNPANETIDILAPELQSGFDYKVGISTWQADMGASIEVKSKYNALGGTAIIRKSATSSSFASIEYKIKIPKAPATPKLKINKGKIIGISTKDHKWSTTEDGNFNNIFAYKAIDINNIETQLGININESQDYIDIYIKTPAKDKKPSSPVQRLRIENPKKNTTQENH